MAGNRRRKSTKRNITAVLIISGIVLGLIFIGIDIGISKRQSKDVEPKEMRTLLVRKPKIPPLTSASEAFPDFGIREEYLPVNDYSRPGIEIGDIEKIVIHYTANPGTDAQANRDYFAGLADTGQTYASSHFVIGLDGTIIQCVPLNEIAYASNEMNSCCISIECCHPDETGEFSTATYNRCVALTAELCKYYQLDPQEDVIRHYDITGKLCPAFYVEHPEEWTMFLGFVEEKMKD